jgi:polysaccharide pyruvyl transferase CsaB
MVGFAEAAESMGINCAALSGNPDETYRYHRISSVPRRNMRQVAAEMEKHDALVFPGGSIFQDVTSVGSVLYYRQLVMMAKKAKKKVFLVGQGVGPLKTFFGKRAAIAAFSKADYICVRDPDSMTLLRSFGVKTPIKVTADSAFLLSEPSNLDDTGGFQVGSMKTVAIAPRPIKGVDVVGLVSDFCQMVFRSGQMPVLVGLDRGEDAGLIQAIEDKSGGKIPDMTKVYSPVELQRRLARMDAMISIRLHGGILATTVGVPSLMIAYDPKVSAFAKLMDNGPAMSLDNLTAARLFDAYTDFTRRKDLAVTITKKKRDEMAKLALGNVEVVRDALR